jgi:hypothetical protein
VVIGTDGIGSYISNYNTITTTTDPSKSNTEKVACTVHVISKKNQIINIKVFLY